MTQFQKILELLTNNRIDFVVVGGIASVAQGAASITADIDICYNRSEENLEKIIRSFKKYYFILRGAPQDLPFIFDKKTLKAGMNFTFSSKLGDIDLLGEVAGIGSYSEVIKKSEKMALYGLECHVLTIEGLLKTKKAANRPKDQIHIAELEELIRLKKN